jgi:hypothetical protein
LRSVCSLGIVSVFVFFLASSAPHRVHHIFENLSHPDEKVSTSDASHPSDHAQTDTADNKNDGKSPKTDCVAASVAQNAHLSIVQVPAIDLVAAEIQAQSKPQVLSLATFNSSPYRERAPPHI